MFTGIVEEAGEITEVVRLPDEALRLVVRGPVVTDDARHGDSISVNGVCLTVTEVRDDAFVADVMRETLTRSSLRGAAAGMRVNLERAVQPTARLGGHIVQGHVDGTATLVSRTHSEHWDVLRFSIPAELARYVVDKGSIAIDGVSLTVSAVDHREMWFEVSLIPTTLALTTLGERRQGDVVNIEVDVIAKYVEGLLQARGRDD